MVGLHLGISGSFSKLPFYSAATTVTVFWLTWANQQGRGTSWKQVRGQKSEIFVAVGAAQTTDAAKGSPTKVGVSART